MTEPRGSILTTWFGAFLVTGDRVERAYPFPTSLPEMAERRRARRAGHLVPEEIQLLADAAGRKLVSRDRRFLASGVELGAAPVLPIDPLQYGVDPVWRRDLVLEEAREALRAGWDPSIHLEESIRAISDLDRILNLISERLASWAGRDAIVVDEETAENPRRVAEAIVEDRWAAAAELPPIDPTLTRGRQALARLYLGARSARETLEAAVATGVPHRAANLGHLLGNELAARLISQAGGLERLARLPSSTVQVLGAEKAFFEHLRGRAPPPRHGLLFLHPSIQSAPRHQRGKLARALAGKASIAARLDLAGSPVNSTLLTAFEQRTAAIRAEKRRGTERRVRRRGPNPAT